MPSSPQSMDEVAEIMRNNLPHGMTPREFGRRMKWGRGSEEARLRMRSLTVEELRSIGLTPDQAAHWAIAYDSVLRLMPHNPSAAGRAELMRHAAVILAEKLR